jgi:ParB family transcriptional regulator, chromosome partitioning protein
MADCYGFTTLGILIYGTERGKSTVITNAGGQYSEVRAAVAKIAEIREIPLEALLIGESQVRVRRVDEGIDELAESIRVHGLLEPILVRRNGDASDSFEVLMGQRRVLAHQRLGRSSILAAIVEDPLDQETAKALSLTENIIRRDLDSKDVIDACTSLYKKYGNARAVAEETGIPYAQVLKHLKYDRLHPALRQKVDGGEVVLNIALKAQDAVTDVQGEIDPGEAVDLAEALSTMTGAERQQILRGKRRDPSRPVKELVEKYWANHDRSRQILVTLPGAVHKALQAHAKRFGITQDEASARLLAAGLQVQIPEELAEDHDDGRTIVVPAIRRILDHNRRVSGCGRRVSPVAG